LLTENVIHH